MRCSRPDMSAKTVQQSMRREKIMSKRRAAGSKWVSDAVKSGKLKPAKECVCVDCGKQAFCYDHRDYSKPDQVEPVCKSCDCLRGPGQPYPVDGIAYFHWASRAEKRKAR